MSNNRNRSNLPEVEVVQTGSQKHQNLDLEREEENALNEALEAGAPDGDNDPAVYLIDEEAVEAVGHEAFTLFQKTGHHESRQVCRLIGRLVAAILGTDYSEFFPDAPPIQDPYAPQGAPTYPGEARPGWPAAHEAHGAGGHMPAMGNMPVQYHHPANPSGAEMRVVDDPTGTMQQATAAPMFVQNPMPAQGTQSQPQEQNRRRRRRGR